MNKVLVVAAHADDESLGCAGTLARHIAVGDQVTVMFMTDGVSSRIANTPSASNERNLAADNALKILGIDDVRQEAFPDNQLDSVVLLEIVKTIENVIKDVEPNIVYTHFAHDLNVDHQITHRAVLTACRPQVGSSVKKILSFEVLSSTEWNSPSLHSFLPQYIVDITAFWDKKLAALNCYDDEMRAYPHSRSYKCVEALATLRGATNGLDKAEAFFVERIIC